MRYMLKYLGVPAKGPAALLREKLGMIIYSTNPDSELKKNHLAISYHKLLESAAVSVVNPIKVTMTVNPSNILMKCMLVGTLGSFSDKLYGVDWGEA